MSLCSHDHGVRNTKTQRLSWALAVIVVFMIVEAIGGWISGSLALLADAGHMLTDAVALSLALSAHFFAARPADKKLHFGYQRAQVLAAFVNGVLMAVLLFLIVFEAVARIFNPVDINAPLMLAVAAFGLLANAAAFLILHRGGEHDLNMRGALLHVIGDLLGSVAAIIAGLTILMTGWRAIDPILSLVVAALIGFSAYRLIRESGFILLEGAPHHVDTDQMATGIKEAIANIRDVDNIQISQLTPDEWRLTMHIRVDQAEDAAAALVDVKKHIENSYNIAYLTIQVEIGPTSKDAGAHLKTAASNDLAPSAMSSPSAAPAAKTGGARPRYATVGGAPHH